MKSVVSNSKLTQFVAQADRSQSPALILSLDGAVCHANEAFLRLLGYELSDLVGRPFTDLIVHEDRVRAASRLVSLKTGVARRTVENRYVARDGSIRWLLWNGEVDHEGGVVLGTAQDVTERRVQQKTFDEIVHEVSRFSGAEFYSAVTRELARQFSVDQVAIAKLKDPATLETISYWAHGKHRTSFEYPASGSICQAVMSRGVLKCLELPKDAYPHDLRFTGEPGECYMGVPIRSIDDNAPIGVLWIIHSRPLIGQAALEWTLRSLSIQIAAEIDRSCRQKELERQLAYNRAILTASPDMLFVLDDDFKYIDFYFHNEAELATPSDQLIGRSIDEGLPPELCQALRKAAAQSRATGEVSTYETTVKTIGGTVEEFEARVVYASDVGLVIYVRKITERKNYERRITDQQMRLVGAARLAAVGEMAAGIAHEINNPICVIAARTMILRDLAKSINGDFADKVRETSERIAVMSERISKIVRSMRTIARDGKEDPFQPFDIQDIVTDVIELSRNRFRNAMIALYEPSIPPHTRLECRPVQISQMLLNLLSNAYDAVRGQSEKWVRIGVSQIGSEVEISIEDSGSGIDPRIADKIMMPFFTTKELGRGTGLGLSISRAIAEDHGGRLELDDSSLHTRFVVRLPLKKDKLRDR